jgi:dTDP-4-dehydrorhamnose reductase
VNAYGRSKAAGEEAVLSLCDSAIVARTSLIYGLEEIDRGTQGFINALKAGQKLNLFTDVLRQPVWIDSLCDAICLLAFDQTQELGTINIAGDQVLSRAAFAARMLEYWGESAAANINQASARDIPGIPLDCTMRFDRARALGIALPGVDEVLVG